MPSNPRNGGKRFNAVIPEELYDILRLRATTHTREHGGQVNVNRELVIALYAELREELNESQRQLAENFIRRL